MNITEAKYNKETLTDKNCSINIVVDNKFMSVPLDPDNRHYQAILEWAKIDGNTIADAD